MKEFVAYLVRNLVDQPDVVNINVVDEEHETLVEVRISPEDIGGVIGRQGRTINALRRIASVVGSRVGRRVRVEVIE